MNQYNVGMSVCGGAEPDPDARLWNSLRFLASFSGKDRLLLAEESESHLLEGRIYIEIAKLTAEGISVRDLERELCSTFQTSDVRAAVSALLDCGFLRMTEPSSPPELEAFWESVPAECAPRALALRCFCSPGERMLKQALESSGLVLTDDAPILLVTTDDYLRPELAALQEEQRPWLLVKPVGYTIWLGPLFEPGKTACWRCMAQAIKPNRWRQCSVFGSGEYIFPPQPSLSALPATLALAAGMIATTTAIWAARGSYPDLENSVLTFDVRTLRQATHTIRSRGDCPACSTNCAPQPIIDLRSLASPITGIVSGACVTDVAAAGLFHASAEVTYPLPVNCARPLLKTTCAFGKGMTADDAETACIAEAIERYSAAYRGDEPLVRARAAELEAIPLESILMFSDSQYRCRDHWNATHAEMHWVPERPDASQAIDWIAARSLTTGPAKYVPAAYVYMWYESGGSSPYCNANSNGCASGRTLDEAILNGLLELVERDSVAIWWYNRLPRPSIRFESLTIPAVQAVAGAFREMGRQLYLLDVTSDLDIPAYVALSPREDGGEPYFASAAHWDPAVAAARTLSELAQIWFWSNRDRPERELARWLKTASLRQDYLAPGPPVELPAVHTLDTADAIAFCAQRLARCGIDSFYVDLTRPEIRWPAVRVIAPGLVHAWPRLGSERLYQVPVRMGWLDKPIPEIDLTSVACMI